MWVQLNGMRRLLILSMSAGTALGADMVQHPHEAGFSSSIGLDYDGSRHRTACWDFAAAAEWGTKEYWLNLSLDAFSDFKSDWRLRGSSYATLQLGKALYRNNDDRLYVNATFDVDVHSQQASQGGELTPEINVAKGLTADWWIGGSLGAVLATAPNAGNRQGYGSLALWVTYLSGWLPNETDSISLNLWTADNETPGAGNALFLSLGYQFSLSDHWEANIGIGTDPLSPWDHLGVYGLAGIKRRF